MNEIIIDQTPKCPQPRSLLLALNTGSLTEEQFAKTMSALAELVGKICGGVGQGPNENRVAVVTFDHRVRLDFKFDVHFTLQVLLLLLLLLLLLFLLL